MINLGIWVNFNQVFNLDKILNIFHYDENFEYYDESIFPLKTKP